MLIVVRGFQFGLLPVGDRSGPDKCYLMGKGEMPMPLENCSFVG